MSHPGVYASAPVETQRAPACADLFVLADVLLGAGPRHEVALRDVGHGANRSTDVVWAGFDDVCRPCCTGELAAAVWAAAAPAEPPLSPPPPG